MNKWKKRLKYILAGIIVVFLLVVVAFKIIEILNEKEQEEAIRQIQQYLAEHYPDLNYDIQIVDSSTDFKHYGYFEHAVTVQNTETKENFIVYYDKKMPRMDDSINIEKQEELLIRDLQPKIEKYIEEHFGETRFITLSYELETGKPMILVEFNENHQDPTQTDFDAFIIYLKETIGLKHATVIVDYLMRDLTFNEEF